MREKLDIKNLGFPRMGMALNAASEWNSLTTTNLVVNG